MKGATIQGCNFQNAHTSSATTKLLVLSPLDRPEEWAEEKVHEQAENVKPYTISIGKEESGVLTLCLEETPLGKVLFSVALDEAKYVRHRKAWHSVRLPDDRRFGLVLVEDAHFTLFSEALSAALDAGAEDQDSIDGPGENCTVKAQAVAVKAPSETRLRRLNLDLGPAATDRATSLSSPPSTMSLSSAAAYGPEPPQLRGGVGELIRRFQTAVSTGNSQEAQAVAKQLTQYRANLDLHVNVSSPTEKEIAVRIHVEDQHSSGGCIVLNLRPSTKISQLKSKILLMYGFAPETQKWIIGKKMAHDEDTLAKCGVQTNNTPVFLYLLAHKTIGMTKEDFQKRYGHLRGPGHRSPPPPTVTTITRQHRPRAAPTPLPAAQTAPVSFQQTIAEVAPIQPITADQTPEPQLSPEGWPCTQCTFLNLWTRHACNICSADRPEHLTPPPNYVIPRSERERLQQEEEEERRAREMQPQRTETDPTLLTLRQRDLDLMLRLIHDARANENKEQPGRGGSEADTYVAHGGADMGGGGGGGGGGGHHDPYSDDLDPGSDFPDSVPVGNSRRGDRSGTFNPDNSDLAIDGPGEEEDSPDGVDANNTLSNSLTNFDNSNEQVSSTDYPDNRLADGLT